HPATPDLSDIGILKRLFDRLIGGLKSNIPTIPATNITIICENSDGNHKIKQVVINMIMMRCRSGHKLFAIPQIACATIATATIFSPCTMPSEINVLSEVIPNANKINAIADGIVNPNQAANAPKYLAFDNPSAIPTWLLAGPGK